MVTIEPTSVDLRLTETSYTNSSTSYYVGGVVVKKEVETRQEELDRKSLARNRECMVVVNEPRPNIRVFLNNRIKRTRRINYGS